MAFSATSRYAKIDTVQATAAGGRVVMAIKLRRLPLTPGAPRTVLQQDRIDILSYQVLSDNTRFWRIADANTALEAETLTAATGAVILVPSK